MKQTENSYPPAHKNARQRRILKGDKKSARKNKRLIPQK
jgi:hypothetical protein